MGSGGSREGAGSSSGNGIDPHKIANGGSNLSAIDHSYSRQTKGEEKKISNKNTGKLKDLFEYASKEEVFRILNNLKDGELYCDPDFPADNSSLYYSEDKLVADKTIVWKRPMDILEEWQKPQLILEGATRDDIRQGKLGDCWFLSSCAAVSHQRPALMSKVMLKNQPLYGDGYQGMVCFRFWRFGMWIDVFMDDRLPTVNGKLIYASCTNPSEFWVSMMEKAYAKLHGSYEAIEQGLTMDALVDLTGGLAERYEIQGKDPNLYRQIMRASASKAFITCSKKGTMQGDNVIVNLDPNGLVAGHAYTITEIRKITHKRGEDKLVRIMNPWADGTEWKGSWSDNDVNWTWVDEKTKEDLGLRSKDDGEFWMSYRDFCKHFSEVTICLTGPDFDGDGVSDQAGHVEVIRGQWVQGVSAGGSRNDLQKFATNPQYLLTLTEPDDFNEDTDDPEMEGKCSIVISLMQERTWPPKRNSRILKHQIGFMIYTIEDTSKALPASYFKYHPDCGKSGTYINTREVSGRFELDPGHYVIIPSPYKVDDEASFMLRVFGEKHFKLTGPLNQNVPEP